MVYYQSTGKNWRERDFSYLLFVSNLNRNRATNCISCQVQQTNQTTSKEQKTAKYKTSNNFGNPSQQYLQISHYISIPNTKSNARKSTSPDKITNFLNQIKRPSSAHTLDSQQKKNMSFHT